MKYILFLALLLAKIVGGIFLGISALVLANHGNYAHATYNLVLAMWLMN